MRDGVILGFGLGNAEWNCSAPHGAGRIASREKVLASHTVSEFKASMKEIYSSCIGKDTLDEAPGAYKDTDSILESLGQTCMIHYRMLPKINIKNAE